MGIHDMALIKVNFKGKDIGDRTVYHILVGLICFIILLVAMGSEELWHWITDTLVIFTAATLLFFTLAYGFIHEKFTIRYVIMMIIGAIIIVVYCLYTESPPNEIAISVVQAIVWASIFSVYIDQLKKKINF